MIPKRLHRYFWEIDPRELDQAKDADYITSRLLDYGKTQDIDWLVQTIGKNKIKQVLKKYRGISRKSAWFWANLLAINPKEIQCLQTRYHRIPFGV